MRVIWKDSRTYKTYRYRDYIISKCQRGWVTDVPGDNNIYYSAEMAHNAVDQMLGGRTRKANPGRHALGIKIVGRKDEESCG